MDWTLELNEIKADIGPSGNMYLRNDEIRQTVYEGQLGTNFVWHLSWYKPSSAFTQVLHGLAATKGQIVDKCIFTHPVNIFRVYFYLIMNANFVML